MSFLSFLKVSTRDNLLTSQLIIKCCKVLQTEPHLLFILVIDALKDFKINTDAYDEEVYQETERFRAGFNKILYNKIILYYACSCDQFPKHERQTKNKKFCNNSHKRRKILII